MPRQLPAPFFRNKAPLRSICRGLAALACVLGVAVAAAAMPLEPGPLPPVSESSARISLPPARLRPLPRQSGPELALVIDDLGHDVDSIRRVAALPVPLTAAFLPYVPDAAARVAIARAAGKEIFLHMPMEPDSRAVDPGPMVLRVSQSAAEIQALLDVALANVPGSVGLNNHMGSRFTRALEPMTAVVAWAKARGLIFLDSRTTPQSVAATLAQADGLPYAVRDVFLDNEPDPSAIRAQLERAVERARQRGTAIAIGHPRPTTLELLEQWIPEALARGIRFTTVGSLALRRACRQTLRLVALRVSLSGCHLRSSPPLQPHG